MSGPVDPCKGGVLIRVWVVPGSRKPGIAGLHGDRIKVKVSSPTEQGKATQAVADLIESRLEVAVELVRGITNREKTFMARGIDAANARSKLGV